MNGQTRDVGNIEHLTQSETNQPKTNKNIALFTFLYVFNFELIFMDSNKIKYFFI